MVKFRFFDLILFFLFLLSIASFYGYFETEGKQIEFFWNLIVLCFIIGALILSSASSHQDRDLYQTGFLFIFSGLLILLGAGLTATSLPTGMIPENTYLEIGGIFGLFLGIIALSIGLTVLIITSYQKSSDTG